jgi:hypothetical protein
MSIDMATPRSEVNLRRRGACARLRALLVAAVALAAGDVDAAVPQRLKDALRSPSAKVRIIAIGGIARTGDPEARGLLAGMLVDAEPTVRAATVDGLVALKDAASLPLLAGVMNDPDPAVRAVAQRAQKALQALVVLVDTSDVEDLSDKSVPGLLPLLHDGFEKAFREQAPSGVVAQRGGVEKGYAVIVKLRALRRGVQDGNGYLEAKCDVTVVEMPGKILRLASSATAAAGVEGALPKGMEHELASDAINACAPALAKDVVEFLAKRAKR